MEQQMTDMYDFEKIFGDFEHVHHIRQETPEGDIRITLYPVVPGIYLALNEVHATTAPSTEIIPVSECITINHCLDGRCEFKLSESNYSYVCAGLTCIGCSPVAGGFYYPSAYYLGYEIYIFPEMFTLQTTQLLQGASIDMDRLLTNMQCRTDARIGISSEDVRSVWKHLLQADREDLGYARLCTGLLLHAYCHGSPLASPGLINLTREQAEWSKQAHDILTADLSRHIAMREIAGQLHVSETSLKKYFRMVYGRNVSDYMHEHRMQYAAGRLLETDDSIADIAAAVGYCNQGRFAKIFREYAGMKPLEYRRLGRS